MNRHAATGGLINDLLNVEGLLGEDSLRLKSNYTLRAEIEKMDDGLGPSSWSSQTLDLSWSPAHPDKIRLYYRDLHDCVRWLLRQPAYEDEMTYAPERRYNMKGERLYTEMHTADWWWEQQVISPAYPLLYISYLPIGKHQRRWNNCAPCVLQ